MVYRIVLTQPLAAGPDGEWEYDLLMEGKPAADDLPLSESQQRILSAAKGGGHGDTASSGEKKAANRNVNDAETTISENECLLKDNAVDRVGANGNEGDQRGDLDDGVGDNGVGDNGNERDYVDLDYVAGDNENEGTHHVGIDHSATTTSSEVSAGIKTKPSGSREDSLDCAGSDTETDVDLELGKNYSHNSDVSDDTNSDDGSNSGDPSAGARGTLRVSRPESVKRPDGNKGRGDLSPSTRCNPEDRHSPDGSDSSMSEGESSVDMDGSASSVDMEEADDDDSSFGESNEEHGDSSEGGESEDGSDGFVPDVVPSICFMKHQNRPPHKDGLCKECYLDLVDRETRAGLRSANGAAYETRQRKRRKRNANGASTSTRGKVRAEETTDDHSKVKSPNKVRRKRLRRRNDADMGKRSDRDRCRQDSRIGISDRTGFRGRRQRRNRVVTSDTDNEDDDSAVNAIMAKYTDGRGPDVLQRPNNGKCIDITSSSCEDSAEETADSPPVRIAKTRRLSRADSHGTLDTDAVKKPTSKVVVAEESNEDGSDGTRTSQLAKANVGNMVGDMLSAPQAEVPDSVGRHSSSRVDTAGFDADGELAPSSSRPLRTESRSWDAHLSRESGAKVGSDNPARACGVGNSAVTPARAMAASTTRRPGTNVTTGGDAANVEKRGMGSSSHGDNKMGKRARNGAASTSARKSNIAEYVELPREVGLQTSWRLTSNLGNASAPSHAETMGLTPLTAEPGSRIAKRIESGYVTSFPPNGPMLTARKDVVRPLSGVKAGEKPRRQQNSSAAAAAPGESSARTGVGTKRGQQMSPAAAEISRTPRLNLSSGKHGEVSATPISSPMNGPRRIDLPMRKGNLESVPSYSPRTDTKIWWPEKLSTSDQPPDGRYLPSLPSAVPLRSALKGGRKAALAQPPTTDYRPSGACTDTTTSTDRGVYNLHDISGDNDGDTAEATAPRGVETTTSSMLCPGVSDDSSRAKNVSAMSGSSLRPAAMSSSGSGEVRVPSCGLAVNASGGVFAGSASSDCKRAGDGKAVARNDVVSSEKRQASSTAEKPGDTSPDSSSRKPFSGLGDESDSPATTSSRRDIVPLRHHLAQMRNRAATRIACGAEASGQQAMSRWMHAKNDDSVSSADAANGDHSGDEANAVRLGVPISYGEHVSPPSSGPVANNSPSDASSSGSDSSIDEDLEDLEEYEKLGEKLVELKRDVGASSLLPPTADSAAQSLDERLEPSSSGVDTSSLPTRDSLLGHANAVAVTSRSVEDSHQESQPAPGVPGGFSFPRRFYEDTYEACSKTLANEDELEPAPHVASPQSTTSEAGAVVMVAEDPVAPLVPLASPVGEETEDVVAEDNPEDMNSCPPVPTVCSDAPSRLSGPDHLRTGEKDAAEVKGRGEPPPAPRVPWQPPAGLSRANSAGDTAVTQSTESPPPGDASSAPSAEAREPSHMNWVTTGALGSSTESSVDDVEALDNGVVTISPSSGHSEETRNEGSQPAEGQEKAQTGKNSGSGAAASALSPVAVSTEQQKQPNHDHPKRASSRTGLVNNQRGNKQLSSGKSGGAARVGVHTTAGACNASTQGESTEARSVCGSDDTGRSESSHGSRRGERDRRRKSSRCRDHRRRSPDRSMGRRSPDRGDRYRRRSASRSPGRSSRRGSRGRDEETYYRRRERSYATRDDRDRDGYRRRHGSCDRSRRESRDEDEDIRRDSWVTRSRNERSPPRHGYSASRSRKHKRSRSR